MEIKLVLKFSIVAAHCVRGASLLRRKFVADFVRFGEYNIETDPDCEDVSTLNSYNYFIIIFILILCTF